MRALTAVCLLFPLTLGCRSPLDTGDPNQQPGDTGADPEDTAGVEQVPGSPGQMEDPVPPVGSVTADCGHGVLDEPKIPCWLQVHDHEGVPYYEGWAGLELRGRSSLYFPKPQYALELWRDARVLVPPGATWRYLAAGQAPADGWTLPDFDDSGWSEGAAPLGYGETDINTELGPATEGALTAWFRIDFQLEDSSSWTGASLAMQRDDGAVVYLNGIELLRDNLPEGTLKPSTPALIAIGEDTEHDWLPLDVDPALLSQGGNTLAVALHQVSADSSDLRFDLRLDAKGADKDVNLFGMGAEEDWILNGNWVDRALFRNKLSFDLFQSFGGPERYAPESVFVQLTVDGDWMGIYTLGERIKRDPSRLPLQDGSFIVKSDDQDEPLVENRVGYGDWVLVHPHDGDLTDETLELATSWIEGWQDAVVGWDYDPDEGIFAWMDMDSAIDFVLQQELAKNIDAYTLSVHIWRDDEGLLHLTPWDFDLAYGYPVDDCGAEGWARRQEWVYAMADHPYFDDALAARWDELRAGPLADETLLAWTARYRAVLEPWVEANAERWPLEEISFESEGQDWLCPVDSYQAEHERFDSWLLQRTAWMDSNIEDFPTLY